MRCASSAARMRASSRMRPSADCGRSRRAPDSCARTASPSAPTNEPIAEEPFHAVRPYAARPVLAARRADARARRVPAGRDPARDHAGRSGRSWPRALRSRLPDRRSAAQLAGAVRQHRGAAPRAARRHDRRRRHRAACGIRRPCRGRGRRADRDAAQRRGGDSPRARARACERAGRRDADRGVRGADERCRRAEDVPGRAARRAGREGVARGDRPRGAADSGRRDRAGQHAAVPRGRRERLRPRFGAVPARPVRRHDRRDARAFLAGLRTGRRRIT
ncbi:2-keto-3-deoxy-6-phosphogluconate aldolase [Burkholderia dolosa AU0158]|nr:2-keto-3-deoxy-6-phosphogluconate aldolase [Burkholderia dolosa AU0158]